MNMSFGNFGGGDDNNRRHLPGPASHFRRDSGDNNHHNSPHPHSVPRGGYRGRGGGYHNNGGSHHGNNYNNSPGASFRNMNHGGRGGANNANNNANNNPGAAASGGPRGNAGYTGSPHQGFRSPAMNQATPVPNYPGAAAAPGMPGYAVPSFPGGPMAPMHHVRNLSLNLSTSPITPTMEGSASGNISADVVATPAIATKDGGGGGNGGNDGNGNGNGSRTTETAHYGPPNANHGNRRGYRGGRYNGSWAARRKRESGSSCRSSFDSPNFPTPSSQHQKYPSDTPSNYSRNPRFSHNRHRESFGSGHHPLPRESLPFHSQFSDFPNYPSPQSCSQATSDQSRCFPTPSSQGHPNPFPPGYSGFPGSQPIPMNIPYMNEDSLTYHMNSQGYAFDPNANAFQYGNPYGFIHQMPYPPSPAPPPMAQQTQSPQAHFRGLSAANVAAAPFIPGRSTFPQQQQSQPPIPGSVPPGSVPPMAANMARTPSQMSHSAERPGSSVGPVPIPAAAQPPSGPVVGSPVPHPATMDPAPMTPIHHHVTPHHHAHTPSLTRGSPTPVAATAMNPIPQPFSPSAPRTAKRSSALVIKDPKTGKELDFKPAAGSAKGTSQNTPASNASPAKSASGKASPSPAAGAAAHEEKKEEQAASAKQSEEETRKEFQAGVLARLKAEKEQKEREEREAKEAKEAEEKKQKEEAEAAEKKKKEEEEAEQKKKQEAEEAEKKKAAEAAAKKEAEEKAEREKEAEEKKKADDEAAAKKKEEDDKAAAAEAEKKPAETPAPAAAEAAPADEEDEFERMVREMEEKEKADIAAEEAYNEKKRKEKEEAEAKKKAEEAAYWADTKRAEAEAEALEEAREKKREAERRAAAGLPPVEEKKGASK
ncbi:ADP-ribosylation factor GTPase activating protein, ER-Golgi transport, partial [Ascosphaera pollenicola]